MDYFFSPTPKEAQDLIDNVDFNKYKNNTIFKSLYNKNIPIKVLKDIGDSQNICAYTNKNSLIQLSMPTNCYVHMEYAFEQNIKKYPSNSLENLRDIFLNLTIIYPAPQKYGFIIMKITAKTPNTYSIININKSKNLSTKHKKQIAYNFKLYQDSFSKLINNYYSYNLANNLIALIYNKNISIQCYLLSDYDDKMDSSDFNYHFKRFFNYDATNQIKNLLQKSLNIPINKLFYTTDYNYTQNLSPTQKKEAIEELTEKEEIQTKYNQSNVTSISSDVLSGSKNVSNFLAKLIKNIANPFLSNFGFLFVIIIIGIFLLKFLKGSSEKLPNFIFSRK